MKLDDRMTELVAIGASAAANCAACLEHHVGKARETGVDAEEIAEALDVGRMVRRGAGATLDRLAARLRTGAAAAPAEGAGDKVGRCGCS